MNDIPLVKDNGINAINTSLIAAKKSLQLVYTTLDNVNKTFKDINKEIDAIDAKFADYLLKDDIVNSITDGDMRPVTSNAVAQIAPVDTVASGNMHAVTSNGVYNALQNLGSIVSRTVCTPYGASTKFNQNDVDCLTDCKYSNGLHHVSGLIVFNPSTTQSNGFYLSATPSRIIDTGNLGWVIGVTDNGLSVICLCFGNGIARWSGADITSTLIVCFDFWYQE